MSTAVEAHAGTTSRRHRPELPSEMFARALDALEEGKDPQRLIDVAVAHRDKWARLVEEQEAGTRLDGRVCIYCGETYAEARDRWDAYRELLVQHITGPDRRAC